MEMSMNDFSTTSDYCSFDELDSETREDLEVALYGMLHHTSNKEDHFVIPSNNNENVSLLPTVLAKTNIDCPNSNNSTEFPRMDTKKVVLEPVIPKCLSSNQTRKQPILNSDGSKKPKLPYSSKIHTIKNSKIREHSLKKNPYSQYLIIEESSDSSRFKKKTCEVITLSDEEDSKYAAINKSSKLRNITKNGLTVPVYHASSPASVEDSESDSSVIVLDPSPGPSLLNLDSSIDSSDSEVKILQPSIINSGKVKLKLNVSQPDVESPLLSSINPSKNASNWEKYASTKWTPDMVNFYDKNGCDNDLDAILKSIPRNVKWYLDIEDRRGTDLQRNRYFGKSAKVKCNNCQQWDHVAKNCPESRKIISCIICGMPGHKQFGCPKKMCLNCGRPSKILIECCPECRREKDIVCMICRSKHVTRRCPDLWRRFHLTTSNGELNNAGKSLKPRNELYCCNCASRGHLVHECPEKRWNKYIPSDPTICSYENPEEFLNNITNNGKSSVSISEDRKEVWVVGSNEQYKSPKKEGCLTYSIPLKQQPSEQSMQAAKSSTLREIKNVGICWRKQLKKGRVLVEFSGAKKDTKEAKYRFKQLITFRKKNESKNKTSEDESSSSSPSTSAKEKNLAAPKGVHFSISAIDINYVNQEGKNLHQHIPISITEKEKRNVGKLLAKLELKNRVQITSCYVGKKWEVTIHKLPNGNPLSAVNSIVSYLDAPTRLKKKKFICYRASD